MIDKEYPVLYTVNDIMNIFGLGQNKAYELLHSSGFPSIKLNRKILVEKSKLEAWISKNSGKEFNY